MTTSIEAVPQDSNPLVEFFEWLKQFAEGVADVAYAIVQPLLEFFAAMSDPNTEIGRWFAANAEFFEPGRIESLMAWLNRPPTLPVSR